MANDYNSTSSGANSAKLRDQTGAYPRLKTSAISLFLVLLAILLSACAANPSGTARQTPPDRQLALQRWHSCLDKQEDIFKASGGKYSLSQGMEICRGYRYDVLATYPQRLTASIDRMLTTTAYKSRLGKSKPEVSEPELARMLRLRRISGPGL